MSAVNPLPSAGPSDKRSYEPSMEEILASIRRIIADDQSLPRASRDLEGPATRLDQPVSMPDRMSVPDAVDAASEPTRDAPVAGPAHGAVAAPQFASPEPTGEIGARDHDTPAGTTVIHAVPLEAEPEVESAEELEPEDAFPSQHIDEPNVADEPPISETPIADPLAAEPSMFEADRDDALSGLEEEGYAVSDAEPAPVGGSAPPEMPPAAPLFSAATDSSVTSAFNMLAATRLADNSDELLGLAREMIRPLLRDWLDENLPTMVERLVRAEIERVARGGR